MPVPSIPGSPSAHDASKEMEHLRKDSQVWNLTPANTSVVWRRQKLAHRAEQRGITGMLQVTITTWCHQDKYGQTASGSEVKVLEY